MKNIIIGCPYTNFVNLEKELKKDKKINCINTKDIISIDLKKIYTKNKEYFFNDIDSVFIRYPYDLIPPHSGNYKLRENTEYLKSIALILSSKSINPIENTWKYRNRLLSLNIAYNLDINVPYFILSDNLGSSFKYFENKNTPILKSIGNCYFSDENYILNNTEKKYFAKAEDSGDIAFIFPVQNISKNDLKKYIKIAGVYFLQEKIVNIKKEYRIYLIENEIFIFSRLDKIDKIDKSEELYIEDNFSEKYNSEKNKLFKLKDKLNLGFLCLDMIETKDNIFLVDINPLGSLPPYENFPNVTIKLADAIKKF